MTILQHLKDRHVNLSTYSLTVDEKERVATFLLFNLSGVVCGYQQYRPDADKKRKNDPRSGRYYTYRTPGQIAVFGLETYFRPGPLFLTEGVFDAVRLHNLGLPAVATLSNDPKHIVGWLRVLSRRKIAVCDPGPSGALLAQHADEVLTCPGDQDVGAMPAAQLSNLLEAYLF